MKTVKKAIILFAALFATVNSQGFHDCYQRITTCFIGLNGYGPQNGQDDVSCTGFTNCDGYLACVKGVQYGKGFACIPVMGPFCVKTLLDVVQDAIGGYLGGIDAKFPRCEIDNTIQTQQYISNLREELRVKYGGRQVTVPDDDDDDDDDDDEHESRLEAIKRKIIELIQRWRRIRQQLLRRRRFHRRRRPVRYTYYSAEDDN